MSTLSLAGPPPPEHKSSELNTEASIPPSPESSNITNSSSLTANLKTSREPFINITDFTSLPSRHPSLDRHSSSTTPHTTFAAPIAKIVEISKEIFEKLSHFDSSIVNRDQTIVTLTHEELEEMENDLILVIKQVQECLLNMFRTGGTSVHPSLSLNVIPKQELENLTKLCEILQNEHPSFLKHLAESSAKEEIHAEIAKNDNIKEFVERFNTDLENRDKLKQEAFARLSRIRKKTWHTVDGKRLYPFVEEVTNTRNQFYLIYTCSDQDIKERALQDLIDVLEGDPLVTKTSFDLILLQKNLHSQLAKKNDEKSDGELYQTENLSIPLQRLLIRCYARTLECILLHSSYSHLNACDEKTREQIWTDAENLAKMNISDIEIKFWTMFSIEGAMRIKTNVSTTEQWLGRIALIVRAGFRVAGTISSPEKAGEALSSAFEDLRNALHHIEWKQDWFIQVLTLTKTSRAAQEEVKIFRNVATIVQEHKHMKSCSELLYGIVTVLEYTVINSTKNQIKEEAFKLLIQYLSLPNEQIQCRVIYAFSAIMNYNKYEMGNTAHLVLELLRVTKNVSSEEGKKLLDEILSESVPLSAKPSYFSNVIKFLIRWVGEIKQEENCGGHSLVTLLSTSEKPFIPTLLNCLKKFGLVTGSERDVYGNTVYHLAAKHNNASMITHVHQSTLGVDINARDFQDMNTAMNVAISFENTQVALQLLEYGANPTLQNKYGDNAFHTACEFGDVIFITKCLAKNTEGINEMNVFGFTPLSIAIYKDNVDIVEVLKKYGAHIDENTGDCLHIHFAAKHRSESCLKYFLEKINEELSPSVIIEISKMMSQDGIDMSCSIEFAEYYVNLLETNGKHADEFMKYPDLPQPKRVQAVSTSQDPSIRSLTSKLVNILQSRRITIGAHRAPPIPTSTIRITGTPLNPPFLVQLVKDRNINTENIQPIHLDPYLDKINDCDINNSTAMTYAAQLRSAANIIGMLANAGADINHANDLGLTPLHIAVAHRNIPGIRALLARGAIVDKPNTLKFTPLHFAAYLGDLQIITILVDAGASVNAVTVYGDTPLHLVCGCPNARVPHMRIQRNSTGVDPFEINTDNQTEIAEFLIGHNASIEAVDIFGNTLLHQAASYGTEAMCGFLCANAPQLFWNYNKLHVLPIKMALRDRRKGQVVILIKSMAKGDWMALDHKFREVTKGEITLGTLLAKANLFELFQSMADFPTIGNDKDNTLRLNTPLHIAAWNGFIEILKAYKDNKLIIETADHFGNTPLHLATIREQVPFLTKLLSYEPTANRKNADGRIPLHLASLKGGLDAIQLLLKYYPRPYEKDSHGNLPVHLSCIYGKIDAVKFFLKLYPDLISATNDDGKTLLHLASSYGHITITKLLITEGANMECKDAYGATPLTGASAQGHTDIVKLLILHKANIWAVNEQGETSLHVAVFGCHVEIVRVLLERNAILVCPLENALVNVLDSNKEAPLHQLAKRKSGNNKVVIFKMLMDAGANLIHCDEQGMNVLHWACFHGQDDLIKTIFNFVWDAKIKTKDILVQDQFGNEPIHKVCESGYLSTLKLLQRLGCDADVENRGGLTPILLAASSKHYHLVEYLLTLNIKIKATDNKGRNLTHIILDVSDLTMESLNLLVDVLKIDPTLVRQRDSEGRFPLHVAAKCHVLVKLNRTQGPQVVIDILMAHFRGDQDAKYRYLWKKDKSGRRADQIADDNNNPNFAVALRNYNLDKLNKLSEPERSKCVIA